MFHPAFVADCGESRESAGHRRVPLATPEQFQSRFHFDAVSGRGRRVFTSWHISLIFGTSQPGENVSHSCLIGLSSSPSRKREVQINRRKFPIAAPRLSECVQFKQTVTIRRVSDTNRPDSIGTGTETQTQIFRRRHPTKNNPITQQLHTRQDSSPRFFSEILPRDSEMRNRKALHSTVVSPPPSPSTHTRSKRNINNLFFK